ncbi:MAG: hypothetical protein JWQ96_1869 [Segetibacter sp.]|nr:hypothetical protein [Segetibacter sp.]
MAKSQRGKKCGSGHSESINSSGNLKIPVAIFFGDQQQESY